MGEDGHWRTQFPDLFQERFVDYAGCHVSFTTGDVPQRLVSRLHLVAVTPGCEVVACRSDRGWRFLPGGTREPGEPLTALARRELMEEAGALVTGELQYFAAHIADSTRPQPYREHLPHPRAYWAYAVVPAQVITVPANPQGAEQVTEVLTLAPSLAAAFIARRDRVHADVLRLADAMGLIRTPV